MEQPITAGCRAEVIDGLKGRDSPNLGLIVKVLHRDGEHSKFGPMWLCEAEYVERAVDGTRNAPPGTAHWAQAWLRRLPADPVPPAAEKRAVDAPVEGVTS